mmetsp:Transcript_1310/g.1888  ORF Transcript_1310/g.1888 Transcript_1310/m.1888 type:complete len:2118 (-) Transcript_1310:113-6466(-)|eukprot:CAMPEP_0194083606 /NCGR_PEP_ID=MMETSP0149-20130528/9661_1 /TAXON_ID=122233 /ORGANISM="Chaetoceros debilis, Strain MM31A-1" /LENGTH=2117 /DNA_ID=CAMNT_0038766043 /DNA_START=289 /DNA_END=6642 /DNA_ORIENTATION=+
MDLINIDDVSGVLIRVVPAAAILYYASESTSKPRFYSGVLTAALGGCLSFSFLYPLFASVGMSLSMVALHVLAAGAMAVGMCLGVLLPKILPGACFGATLAILSGFFLGEFAQDYMGFLFPLLALFGVLLSSKFNSGMLMIAVILESGAAIGSLFNANLFYCISAVARGEKFMPMVEGRTYTYIIPVVTSELYLGLSWIIFSIIVLVALAIRQGGLIPFHASPSSQTSSGRKQTKEPSTYYQPPAASPDTYNMFDPADLPPRLAEYANMVYSACEDLGNFFGFQDSAVRNQAEHLLILLSNNRRYMNSHILPPSVQPPSPIHALHAKVFSNYMKWCRAMGVTPNFAKMSSAVSAPPAVASRVVDLVLFFSVWGESSNIRHMPECMWFLYHKMMEDYILSEGYTQTRSLYAGHFVDNVVSPIYEIVSKSMKSKADHPDKRNYDDFNEFFWSRNCLKYRYCSISGMSDNDEESFSRFSGRMAGDQRFVTIVEGLESAPKTFLEKRSWLRGLIALFRIFEWHLVTFYLLSVIAFARALVWGWVYTLQVASGVFWIFNSLQVVFGILEVWSAYPGIQLTGTAVCGSVFTMGTRFLILIYQTMYLMWTFGPSTGASISYMGIEADANFWWWQYVWLSLLCMIPWMMEVAMQIYPASLTALYTSRNDYVQSFLNILFPLSRLYVGKEVHESFSHTIIYVFFWITLMTWKLFFSYVFEVYSMVLPTLELVDDYINFPDQSFAKMSLVLTMRWMPQFLVYLIDMSIWYAVWQAFAGTSVGISENLGDIKTMDDIRKNFGRAPELFCKKMLSPDAGSRRGSSASFMSRSGEALADSESQALLGADPHQLQSYVNRLLDVRIQKWVMFSAAWNEIIDHFREEDIVSNTERDNLKFSRFEGFSQSIYLPVFQTAGVMDDVITVLETPREDEPAGPVTDEEIFKPIIQHVTMKTAVFEVWELGTYLIQKVLGPIHSDDIVAVTGIILKWTESGTLSDHLKIEKVRSAMNSFIQLVTILNKGVSRRTPAASPRKSMSASRGPSKIRRAVSATSLSLASTEGESFQKSRKESQSRVVIIDALRDQTRDKMRAVVQAIKGILKDVSIDAESKDILDRFTFLLSMENGFLWDDAYASDQLDTLSRDGVFKEVLTKLHGLVSCHPDDVEPKSKEVRRRLTFFVNSLFMDIPDAPSIHDMFSFNVLTPYYSEDVLYNKGDLEKRTDELGVSTLLYLQTLFRGDWDNFLERNGIKDPEKIWSDKFIEETRIWASIRAQTLFRTVSGMMYYEKALRLLANLERMDDGTTEDLLGEKFGYIVSCQVYGNQKKNQDPKAEDIEMMMHRYPHLRIAYIDSIRLNRAGASVFYSVLVKSDGQGGITEIYRVRLPGNPVLGEGKPENQNHAMIFSRGEFVQTIDMNQEGYFEEALKMRNALQEFAKRDGPLPTTILGLREHIFTASVSSLANYMALQETSFVTLGQRVLTKPLRIRLHYGHPDVFDKLFFITRGGISKSSKGINLSEDIFAGYNNAIRGGQVGFKEYLQVGKGRDVGMSQIYKFEAKLSQGAGEQSLSRDVYRLCHRLDFCRLLSFYFGGIGHYFSNVLTILTVYCVVYLMVALAIFDMEKIGDRTITPMGTIQMMLGGLGLLQTIPLYSTLGVERGWWTSCREIMYVFITGGPLHFMFHIQTKAHYMSQTILVGGAKYRATGRGFVTQHTPMDEQFRFFASSHLYLGVELAAGLIIMGVFTIAKQYFGRTWSLWLASISFLASPFWFNPLTFEWNVVVSDYMQYLNWMGGVSGGPSKSWSIWWNAENSYFKGMSFASKGFYVVKSTLFVLVANGIRTSDLFKANLTLNKPFINIGGLCIAIVLMIALRGVFKSNQGNMPYAAKQTIGIILFLGTVAGTVILFIEDSNAIRYSLAAYYFVGALCQIGLLYGVKSVKSLYFIHDLVCGHIIFIPLFILAGLQLPHHIQTWLLYQNALSSDVVVSNILRYAQKAQKAGGDKDDEELIEQVAELRKLLHRQEKMLSNAGLLKGDGDIEGSRNESTDALTELVSPNNDVEIKIKQPVTMSSLGNRMGGSRSMTGLDVYGPMTIGDDQDEALRGVEAPNQSVDYQVRRTMDSDSGFVFSQPDRFPKR